MFCTTKQTDGRYRKDIVLMKNMLLPLKRNVAVTLISHTAVVLLIGLLCAALSDGFALVFCILISIVAITAFTFRNICRCVAEDFEQRAKDLEKGVACLEAMSADLQRQVKELERRAVFLHQYSTMMETLAAVIGAANKDTASMQNTLQVTQGIENPKAG